MSNNSKSACTLDISLNDGRNISLKNLTGKTITLKFEKSQDTETFNLTIQDKEGTPLEEEVTNVGVNQNETLSNHNIHKESTSNRAEGMKILVKDPKGKIITLECYPSDTIEKIKKIIYDEEGISTIEQNLLFKGKQLEDERTLADYNILHKTAIQLELRSHESVSLGLVEMDEDGIPLDVNESDSTNDIKIEVQSMGEVTRYEKQLIHVESSNEEKPQLIAVKHEVTMPVPV